MATTQVLPSQAERLEAEAEAGPGANMSAANVEKEKVTNGSGTPSELSDGLVDPKVEPPEAKRTKANIALLMTALGVCDSVDYSPRFMLRFDILDGSVSGCA